MRRTVPGRTRYLRRRRRRLLAQHAVPLTFGSAQELARNEEVDLVVVTVKVPHHLELIRPALEAGKTVFSEWPLGVDLAQAEELADLAHRRGC
ncbi:Gfo/Idh/MocA family oxidoreductase [Kitasatospora sp. NPDC101155]|uniref:Gfo/Idh/MocA family oxidoreductase n=1 Tax=Kitasatospora sp. NPDC101155 TaxID=3364097 RepID=UPI003822B0AB